MTTRHLVDPETLAVLDMPPLGLGEEDLHAIRARFRDRMAAFERPAVQPDIRHVPGPDGAPDIASHLFGVRPGASPRPAIYHVHGGGMVVGSAAMAATMFPPILASLDVVGVSVEYRLAPDATFPGPQEDVYAGLAWLVAHASELGVDASRIVVMGESAGGGLAAALAQMVRDRGETWLAGQVLIYPMLDHRTGGRDDVWCNPTAGEFVWTAETNQFGWESLRGDYAVDDARRGWFSPALAKDLSGLPPTYIDCGALDILADEALDYARRLAAAGVPTECHMYPGAVHGFNMAAEARVSVQAYRDKLAGLARLLGVTTG